MNRWILVLALCIPAVAEKKEAPTIDSLAYLAGNWSGAMSGGGTFHAHYSKPNAGKVRSFSELHSGGRAVFYEFETFEARDGALVLTPYPGGRKAQSFRLTSLEENKAVFENPKKDFPTKIVYHRVAAGNLVITLTDPHNQSDKQQKFDLKRAK